MYEIGLRTQIIFKLKLVIQMEINDPTLVIKIKLISTSLSFLKAKY